MPVPPIINTAPHPDIRLREALPELVLDPHNHPSMAEEIRCYLEFYQLPVSPSPLCATHAIGTSRVGHYEIVGQYWSPAQPCLGTVWILHGYYDHSGLFHHLIRFLLALGYGVVVYDQPGHGLSSGERASIDDFSTYARTLDTMLQKSTALPQPCFAIGQSTGAAVLLHALMVEKFTLPFKKIVLLAPLIRPAHWESSVWAYRLLSPFLRSLPRHYAQNSNDLDFVDFVRFRDPLQPRQLKICWVRAMKHWLQLFPALGPLNMQALIIQGKSDDTVDWRSNIPLLQSKLTRSTCVFLDDARHHLVNERKDIREEVFRQIEHFLLAS